MLRVVRISN